MTSEREALEAIRAMIAGHAGQPTHLGDIYKIADAALATPKPDAKGDEALHCSLCKGTREVPDNISPFSYPETAPCPKCSDGEWAYRALRAKGEVPADVVGAPVTDDFIAEVANLVTDLDKANALEMVFPELRTRFEALIREALGTPDKHEGLVEALGKIAHEGRLSADEYGCANCNGHSEVALEALTRFHANTGIAD